MCFHGVYKMVNVINPNQNKKQVVVDACISNEVQSLNNKGVITLGSCCGHGNAGKIVEWESEYGNWKSYYSPPHALISGESVELAKQLGYHPFPYYYSDGLSHKVWQMQLKTGCITETDCIEWHAINDITLKV